MKRFLFTTLFTSAFVLISNFSIAANDTLTTASGIKYVQLSTGNGVHPLPNQKVKIIYSRKNSNGEIVESNELSKPFVFRVDSDEVIPGLDEIVKEMSQGEEIYCIIPPELAHGEKGVKGHIDPNSTFYIYIQIIDIE